MLGHKPEPETEFCLTCEMSFLFRMLHDAKGAVCQARSGMQVQACCAVLHGNLKLAHQQRFAYTQASNLIRALRQSREAAALGLLEGQTQPSSGRSDIEVNVNKVNTAWPSAVLAARAYLRLLAYCRSD